MGGRASRARASSSVGSGKPSSKRAATKNGSRNNKPVTAGIQYSETPASKRERPTSFTTLLATMKEHDKPASNTSVARRPSRYLTTSPQTIPSGKPLRKIAKIFSEKGSTANANRASSAKAIKPTSNITRRVRATSETHLIPKYFETV